MPDIKHARVVEITLWFGPNRKMRVRADDRVSIDPGGDEVRFRRSGAGDDQSDNTKIVKDVIAKCLAAYSGSDGIDILVENGKILPSS